MSSSRPKTPTLRPPLPLQNARQTHSGLFSQPAIIHSISIQRSHEISPPKRQSQNQFPAPPDTVIDQQMSSISRESISLRMNQLLSHRRSKSPHYATPNEMPTSVTATRAEKTFSAPFPQPGSFSRPMAYNPLSLSPGSASSLLADHRPPQDRSISPTKDRIDNIRKTIEQMKAEMAPELWQSPVVPRGVVAAKAQDILNQNTAARPRVAEAWAPMNQRQQPATSKRPNKAEKHNPFAIRTTPPRSQDPLYTGLLSPFVSSNPPSVHPALSQSKRIPTASPPPAAQPDIRPNEMAPHVSNQPYLPTETNGGYSTLLVSETRGSVSEGRQLVGGAAEDTLLGRSTNDPMAYLAITNPAAFLVRMETDLQQFESQFNLAPPPPLTDNANARPPPKKQTQKVIRSQSPRELARGLSKRDARWQSEAVFGGGPMSPDTKNAPKAMVSLSDLLGPQPSKPTKQQQPSQTFSEINFSHTQKKFSEKRNAVGMGSPSGTKSTSASEAEKSYLMERVDLIARDLSSPKKGTPMASSKLRHSNAAVVESVVSPLSRAERKIAYGPLIDWDLPPVQPNSGATPTQPQPLPLTTNTSSAFGQSPSPSVSSTPKNAPHSTPMPQPKSPIIDLSLNAVKRNPDVSRPQTPKIEKDQSPRSPPPQPRLSPKASPLSIAHVHKRQDVEQQKPQLASAFQVPTTPRGVTSPISITETDRESRATPSPKLFATSAFGTARSMGDWTDDPPLHKRGPPEDAAPSSSASTQLVPPPPPPLPPLSARSSSSLANSPREGRDRSPKLFSPLGPRSPLSSSPHPQSPPPTNYTLSLNQLELPSQAGIEPLLALIASKLKDSLDPSAIIPLLMPHLQQLYQPPPPPLVRREHTKIVWSQKFEFLRSILEDKLLNGNPPRPPSPPPPAPKISTPPPLSQLQPTAARSPPPSPLPPLDTTPSLPQSTLTPIEAPDSPPRDSPSLGSSSLSLSPFHAGLLSRRRKPTRTKAGLGSDKKEKAGGSNLSENTAEDPSSQRGSSATLPSSPIRRARKTSGRARALFTSSGTLRDEALPTGGAQSPNSESGPCKNSAESPRLQQSSGIAAAIANRRAMRKRNRLPVSEEVPGEEFSAPTSLQRPDLASKNDSDERSSADEGEGMATSKEGRVESGETPQSHASTPKESSEKQAVGPKLELFDQPETPPKQQESNEAPIESGLVSPGSRSPRSQVSPRSPRLENVWTNLASWRVANSLQNLEADRFILEPQQKPNDAQPSPRKLFSDLEAQSSAFQFPPLSLDTQRPPVTPPPQQVSTATDTPARPFSSLLAIPAEHEGEESDISQQQQQQQEEKRVRSESLVQFPAVHVLGARINIESDDDDDKPSADTEQQPSQPPSPSRPAPASSMSRAARQRKMSRVHWSHNIEASSSPPPQDDEEIAEASETLAVAKPDQPPIVDVVHQPNFQSQPSTDVKNLGVFKKTERVPPKSVRARNNEEQRSGAVSNGEAEAPWVKREFQFGGVESADAVENTTNDSNEREDAQLSHSDAFVSPVTALSDVPHPPNFDSEQSDALSPLDAQRAPSEPTSPSNVGQPSSAFAFSPPSLPQNGTCSPSAFQLDNESADVGAPASPRQDSFSLSLQSPLATTNQGGESVPPRFSPAKDPEQEGTEAESPEEGTKRPHDSEPTPYEESTLSILPPTSGLTEPFSLSPDQQCSAPLQPLDCNQTPFVELLPPLDDSTFIPPPPQSPKPSSPSLPSQSQGALPPLSPSKVSLVLTPPCERDDPTMPSILLCEPDSPFLQTGNTDVPAPQVADTPQPTQVGEPTSADSDVRPQISISQPVPPSPLLPTAKATDDSTVVVPPSSPPPPTLEIAPPSSPTLTPKSPQIDALKLGASEPGGSPIGDTSEPPDDIVELKKRRRERRKTLERNESLLHAASLARTKSPPKCLSQQRVTFEDGLTLPTDNVGLNELPASPNSSQQRKRWKSFSSPTPPPLASPGSRRASVVARPLILDEQK